MEDDFSGFDVAVSSDGGTTFSEIHQDQTSNSYTAPTDGKIVVKVITKDFAGNKNDTCISPIYIKDNSAPTCPTVTAKAGKTTLTPGKWTQEPKVEFTFKFSKDTTAWDWYTNSSKGEFTYNNVRYKKWNQEKYNVSFNKQSISGQGKRKILLYVYDAAGNKSVACQYGDYNIDHCESTETEWNKWSSCTNAKNCGTGTQTRTGTLVSKLNNNITCGKKNAQKESQSCYTGKDCCGPLKITGDSKYQAVGPFKCECNKEAIYQNARLHFHIDGCIDGDISGYICYYNPNLSSSYRIRCDKFKAVYGQKHINYKKGGGGHACFASKTDWYYYRSTEQGYAYVCNQDNQCTSTHISTNG